MVLKLNCIKPDGFSLVEVLVSLMILSVVSIFVGALMTSTRKNYLEMSEKSTFLDYQLFSSHLLSKNATCDCNFKNLVFNSLTPTVKNLVPSLKMNCLPGAPIYIKNPSTPGDPQFNVNQLYFTNAYSTGNSNEYSAQLIIEPLQKHSPVKYKPIPIPFNFHTDPSSPNNAKIIDGCGKAPLSVPTNLSTTPGNTQCSINWQASAGALPITYRVMQSLTAGQASTGTLSCSSVSNSCLVTSLTNNTTYYFAVQATNPWDSTSFSSEVSCIPVEPAGVPNITSAAPSGSNTCKVNWTPPTGTPPLTYEVRYSTIPGMASTGTPACSGTSSTTCSIPGLTTGMNYYFTVNASNALGPSSFSAEATCSPLAAITIAINFVPTMAVYSVAIPLGYSSFTPLGIDWLPAGGLNTSTQSSGAWRNVWSWPCDDGNWLNLFLSGSNFYLQSRGDEDCSHGWRHSAHVITVQLEP